MGEIIAELDGLRKKMSQSSWMSFGFLILALVLGQVEFLSWYGWGISLLAALVMQGRKANAKETYIEQYYIKLIPELLKLEFEDATFYVGGGITQEELKRANLRFYGDSLNSKNRIEATYKGMPFALMDVGIFVRKDKKNKDELIQTFKGRWMVIGWNKNFEGEVHIHTKPDLKYHKWLQKIAFEDVTFNKVFKSFATTEHLAFYVITPPIMERIMKLLPASQRDGKSDKHYDFCFENGCLHTTSESDEDYFVVNPRRKINVEKLQKEVQDAVRIVKRTIDILQGE